MTLVSAKIEDKILKEFRDVIYVKKGLRKDDFKNSLEDALLDYILKYSKSPSAKEFVRNFKESKR